MRRLMNLNEMESIDEDALEDKIIQSLKKQLGGDKEIYIKLVDNRPGKDGKVNIVKQTLNGEIIDIDDNQPEPVTEGIRNNLKIGAICFILASGAVSCKKDVYDLGKDARYRLKPNILNSLGKKYFDSPVENKDKIYIWAGNQNGSSEPTRYLYHDYTNQEKSYGEVYGQNYPDSFARGANGVTPSLVVDVLPFNSDIIPKLNQYNVTGKPLDTLLGKYKNVVVVEVLQSSYYDWSDIFNPKEVGTNRKTGHAIYLTNLTAVEVGELYPQLFEVMFGTYKNPTAGNDKIISLNDYYISDSGKLLGDKPEL